MLILGVDPGPTRTGWALWDGLNQKLVEAGISTNEECLYQCFPRLFPDMRKEGFSEMTDDRVAVLENIVFYSSRHAGATTFETCIWIGRYIESFLQRGIHTALLDKPKHIGPIICNNPRAKTADIWRMLKEEFGPPGTKKNPGRLHLLRGVKNGDHHRSAFAVAVAYWKLDRLSKVTAMGGEDDAE